MNDPSPIALPEKPYAPRSLKRIVGYDFARALAIFGMVIVHYKIVMGAEKAGPHGCTTNCTTLTKRRVIARSEATWQSPWFSSTWEIAALPEPAPDRPGLDPGSGGRSQ